MSPSAIRSCSSILAAASALPSTRVTTPGNSVSNLPPQSSSCARAHSSKPGKLIGVWLTAPGINLKEFELSPSDYFIFRDQNRTLQDLGLYAGDSVSVTGVAEPEQVRALRVTDGTLSLLGMPPLLGRSFTKQDDSPGAPETVMLFYGYWRRKFGGDSSVMGRNIIVDGKSRQIIGVLPQRFHRSEEH